MNDENDETFVKIALRLPRSCVADLDRRVEELAHARPGINRSDLMRELLVRGLQEKKEGTPS